MCFGKSRRKHIVFHLHCCVWQVGEVQCASLRSCHVETKRKLNLTKNAANFLLLLFLARRGFPYFFYKNHFSNLSGFLWNLLECVSEQKHLVNLALNVFFSPQLSATLAIPFWQWFLTRFGKKTAVYVGTLVSPTTASKHHF